MLARRSEGTHWRHEKHDSGTHRRDEHCERILNGAVGLVPRIYDWVRRIVLLSLDFRLISQTPLVP